MRRFEIYWVELDPTLGAEIQKTRPAAIISPDEMNDSLKTILVLPITSRSRNIPTRIAFNLNGIENYLALDQIRAVDKTRLRGKIDQLGDEVAKNVCRELHELFAY